MADDIERTTGASFPDQEPGGLKQTVDKVTDKASRIAGSAAGAVDDVGEKIRDVSDFIHRRPMAATGLALLIGFVAGLALRGSKTVYVAQRP